MTVITTNKDIDNDILKIVQEEFERQKKVKILSIYGYGNDIYGVYIAPLSQTLSFYDMPLTTMSTDIDGHDIHLIELGLMLQLIYQKGSIQMYDWLLHESDIKIDNKIYDSLIDRCYNNPPLHINQIYLIDWTSHMNDGTLDMDVKKLFYLYQLFDKYYSIGIVDSDNEVDMKNQINKASQKLKSEEFRKISEFVVYEIDKLFIQLQLDLYITDDK